MFELFFLASSSAVGQESPARLAYNIYKNATHTQIWGSAYSTSGSPRAVDLVMNYGSGHTQISYYARVPAQDDALSDTYEATFRYASDAAVRAVGYSRDPPDCSSSMPVVSSFEFGVRAKVNKNCLITASSLDFGDNGIELARRGNDGVSSITVRCSSGANYSVALDAGTGAGATVAERRMTHDDGPEFLLYGLYLDSAHTRPWGDGSAGTDILSGTGQGMSTENAHSVYGRLLPQPLPPTGRYRDRITATITF